MIDLTPLEVRQKKGDFRRAFRGYDAELVNDFLDLVADRMEELVKENMALRDSVEGLEGEVVLYREKERALSDALMAAQRLREDARSHAEKEGELMIREARLAAETAREEAMRALAREEEALREARARRAQLVESFRRLLERELGELTVLEQTLEIGAGQPQGRKGRGKGRAQPAASEAAPADEGEDEAEAEAAEPAAGEVQEDWLSSLVEE
ncbi:MAG: DivIVA domain-containing protein [Gemmatimonadetes bacterium]|nr:DivIVA domain-containing protein [Gemmatimonadota bacterium]